MLIYPAIDIYDGQAVRLYKGDYQQMTVYNPDPLAVAMEFKRLGATHIHLVDLEGAKLGTTPNFDLVTAIQKHTGLFCEIGGGIRDMETIGRYLDAGIDRVILARPLSPQPALWSRLWQNTAIKSPWALISRTASLPSRAGRRPPRKRPWTSAPKCRKSE